MAAAGAGGAETKYVENNFSTQVYRGTGAARSITSGVDLSTDGGLVITKNRSTTNDWMWGSPTPPTLGTGRWITSNSIAQRQNDAQSYTAFNDDGYSIGTSAGINGNGNDLVGYSFRKTPGILDIVEFVGNGANSRNISHNLGSKPGWITIMCTTKGENKTSWHRCLYDANWVFQDSANGASNGNNAFPQHPTSTQFTIGSYNNISGETYVAWIFGGGEQQGNSSVNFRGSDSITVANGSTLDFGSGDFTIEGWVKRRTSTAPGGYDVFCASSNYLQGSGNSFTFYIRNNGITSFLSNGSSWISYDSNDTGTHTIPDNTWTHVAWTRSNGTNRHFINGNLAHTFTDTRSYASGTKLYIGASDYSQNGTPNEYGINAHISNLRVTKAQALYTSSFTPSTTPLTLTTAGATASNVAVLCCNDTGASGYTQTPLTSKGGGLTLYGDPIGNTDSPFASGTATDAGAIFGANEDKSLIKCGSYVGNGSSSGQPIDIGWESQWVLIKNVSAGGNGWMIYDTMRGWFNNNQDRYMMLNSTNAGTTFDSGHPSSRGFEIATNNPAFNDTGNVYMYITIRRSDPEVGKPPEAGTDAFNVVYGNSSSIIPNFTSNFPVDMGIYKEPTNTYSWYLHTRLTGNYAIRTNDANAQGGNDTDATFDSPTGWGKFGYNTDKASWMWKRHAGFDVVGYTGNSTNGRLISHGLSKVPEMIWIKRKETFEQWFCWHKGLNGGTNPEQYSLEFTAAGEVLYSHMNNTAPTSTNFTVGTHGMVNETSGNYTAFLFASVEGISKCGKYTAPSTPNEYLNINCGFVPRFILIKAANLAQDWTVFDTLRGLTASAGNDPFLLLNTTNAQYTTEECVELTSTGFRIKEGWNIKTSFGGYRYLYYAHA